LTPKPSLVLVDYDFDPQHEFEDKSLMFWSDRLTLRGRDPKDYPQHGYHPYVVSSRAEPFELLRGVPADAWFQAFDMARPATAPPLPEAVRRVEASFGNLHVLGYAAGRSDSDHDRYAFYVRADGVPSDLFVTFRTAQMPVALRIAPEASLITRQHLVNAAWYVVPAIGPRLEDVSEIAFGPNSEQRVATDGAGAG
jgi:hypothetical protein